MKYENSWYILLSSAVLLTFVACTKDKSAEVMEASAQSSIIAVSQPIKQPPKIEVVANANAKAIKVAEKKIDENQSNSYYYDYNIKRGYDPRSQPANKDASVRVKPRTSVDANIHIRSPYENVQVSMLVSRLSKTFRVKCSACHDDYANGIIGPSLLSRDSDYIYGKIADFKSGKKSNPLMDDLIKMMSDDEIRSLADEISNFNQQIKKMREKK